MAAELLPVRADLFPLCSRSAAGARGVARELSCCLAASALPAVLQGRLGSGSAPVEISRRPLSAGVRREPGGWSLKSAYFPAQEQVYNSEI